MKKLTKWFFRLIFLLVLLVVLFVVFLDNIARAVAENQIRNRTGMDVKIGNISVGLLSPVITIENFKLYNTSDFGGGPMVDLPELHIEYDRTALFSRKLRFGLVRVVLNELSVVQDKSGKSNLQALHDWESAKKRGGFEFAGIKTLNLTAQKITLVDLRNSRNVMEAKLGIKNQIIQDIRDEKDLTHKVGSVVIAADSEDLRKMFAPGPFNLIKLVGLSIEGNVQDTVESVVRIFKK